MRDWLLNPTATERRSPASEKQDDLSFRDRRAQRGAA
jgi:hypothetical protein